MDIANFGANFSMAREHLTLFAFLIALPLISFASIKFWIAARANQSQRRTEWFVMHYSKVHQPWAFAPSHRRTRRPRPR